MRRCFLFFAGLMLLFSGAIRAERVMVISDPHVIAQSLLSPGTALDDMMASGRKMHDLSEEAFRVLIDTALLYQPSLVLLPGDLTKDGEKVSHQLVAQQLERLRTAGIQVLVIPGNHDISNPASYSYMGDEKTKVANISDAEFDQLYAAFMPSTATMRDTESHSYVAEPLPGVTILAIDGSHGDAGTGWISQQTLNWLLAQADKAVAKGNLVIAMCHWQLVSHVDQQAMFMSASQLQDADTIAQQLANHKVRLVLTGHFHINGGSTAFYKAAPDNTTQVVQDSLVEITTGSPIAYPCPYRWLEISKDRSTVTVSTDDIRSLASHPDMQTYSRQWQETHTASMAPELGRRLWGMIDDYIEQMKKSTATKAMAALLETYLPKGDARIEMFERHMGQSVVDLYMLHSDANEPERPEKDAVKSAFKDNLSAFMTEAMSSPMLIGLKLIMIEMAQNAAEVPVESMCEDETSAEDASYTNRTDDLQPVLRLNEPMPTPGTGLEQTVGEETELPTYDILGRPAQKNMNGQVLIQKNKKYIKR